MRIAFDISEEDVEVLDRLSEEDHRTRAAYVRKIVLEHISGKKVEDGNDARDGSNSND